MVLLACEITPTEASDRVGHPKESASVDAERRGGIAETGIENRQLQFFIASPLSARVMS